MRRAIKVLSVLAVVCAMAWAGSPALATCGFQIPMIQGGLFGDPPGALLNSGATHVNGFFWELGFGDPADGAGNDSNSLVSGWPAFTQADPLLRWIKGAPAAPAVDFDWGNAGVDNCISGGAANIVSTVLVYYVIDSNEDYAIMAAQGTSTPIAHNSLDLLVTGIGPNGNDVRMGARSVAPHVTGQTRVDANCLDGNVGPATDGMFMYSDAGGPYAGVVDTSGLTLMNGVTPEACDPGTGCHLTCIERNANLCWQNSAVAIASASPPSCAFAPTIVCDPSDPANAACFGGAAGDCLPGVTTPFGPSIPGGCQAIGGDTVDDHAIARATKSRGFTVFTWNATQFAVSHYNVLDVTRGERRINHDVITRSGDNDGSVTSYEFVASGKDIRGGKSFVLEMVRTDGQTVRFPVE